MIEENARLICPNCGGGDHCEAMCPQMVGRRRDDDDLDIETLYVDCGGEA